MRRYAKAGNTSYYPLGEHAPAHRGTDGQWVDLMYRDDTRSRRQNRHLPGRTLRRIVRRRGKLKALVAI